MKIKRIVVWVMSATIAGAVFLSQVGYSADGEETMVFEAIDIADLSPAQVSADGLKAGLDAFYYIGFFERDVRRLPMTEGSEFRSFRGDPVVSINHQFGEDKVFGSGESRGVGMRLTGYLFFPVPGVYDMQALSNDGIILTISGETVLNDPEQHSDRLSNLAHVTIDNAGWYPLRIDYFQRKGTAALKLFWQPPGADELTPVPSSSYGHK